MISSPMKITPTLLSLDVNTGETPFAVEYELSGFESIQGELEIDAIGEDVRVPRAGKITVNADGSYEFEPRSVLPAPSRQPSIRTSSKILPLAIQYAMERAGGPLIGNRSRHHDRAAAGRRASRPARTDSSNFILQRASPARSTSSWASRIALLTLDNYSEIFNRPQLAQPGFLNFFKNSFIITIPSTIIPIAIASLAAYAFTWLNLPYRNVFYLATIAMLIVPLQTTWIPVLRMLNAAGLIGTWPGIWIAHSSYGTPFAIFLLYNFFRDLPGELFEAARVDGASEFGMFFRIVLPLSLPALASLAIFQFVWVWNDLMNALIFLVDQQKFPLTVGIRQLVGQYANEWDILASGAFITMLVPLLVFFSLQRYFVRGVTAGAVKG